MNTLDFYIVDVFTTVKYGGNQLAVFVDYDNALGDTDMLNITRELNFPEVTFIKKNDNNQKFDVRIFTPEYEVPFAGHPSLGTAFVISKYLIPKPKKQLILNLKQGEISIDITSTNTIDTSKFIMYQTQPEFISSFSHSEISEGLGVKLSTLNTSKPIEEISTGLPYIIIPVNTLKDISTLKLDAKTVTDFLLKHSKYKTNSTTGLSTSLFFVTEETFEKENNFNTRMFCIEDGKILEDSATGSANGCLLAYLLKNESDEILAITEQGFQMQRKSYISLEGRLNNRHYTLAIGGCVVDVSQGKWKI